MLPYTEQNMFRYLWELRGRLLSDIIDSGETSLVRALGMFQAHCRRHRLDLQVATAERDNGEIIRMLTGAGDWTPMGLEPEAHPPGAALPDGKPLLSWTSIAGARTIRPAAANYDHVGVRYLLELSRTHEFDAIVELGSGLGERLFELYLAGGPAHIPYFGAEYWESGRAAADRLAALAPQLDFRSIAFDLSRPDFGFLRGYRRVLLFSNSAIYCVSNLPNSFAATLAGAAECMTGVHFELIHHQVAPAASTASLDYAHLRQHNSDFTARMFAARDSGILTIPYFAPDAYALSSGQPVTILHWATQREKGSPP